MYMPSNAANHVACEFEDMALLGMLHTIHYPHYFEVETHNVELKDYSPIAFHIAV